MYYDIYARFRDERKLSDSKVASMSKIGKSTFSDWKAGRSTPKADKLQKIADCLGITLDELTGNKRANTDLFSGIEPFRKEKEDSQFYDHERFHVFNTDRSAKQEDDQYYIDPETASIAQQIKDSPDLRMLLDASRDLSPDTLRKFAEMMLLYKK